MRSSSVPAKTPASRRAGAVIASVPKQQGVVAEEKRAEYHVRNPLDTFMTRDKHFRFDEAYRLDPFGLVEVVKGGVPAALLVTMARDMNIAKERLYDTLGLARATINRKVKDNRTLSADESSRVMGVARLVGQAQTMVEQSGNPEGFDAAGWVAQWLKAPLPALGGRTPGEFMDTAEGQALISGLLDRAQSGAYA